MPGEKSNDFPARVGAACHDLRTPLASVYGFARTLERLSDLDDQGKRCVEMVVAGSNELMRLLDDLSSVARLEGGTFVAAPAPVALHEVAEAAATEAMDRIGVAVPLVQRDGGRVVTDVKLAARALANLIESVQRLSAAQEPPSLVAEGDAIVLGELSREAESRLDSSRDLRASAATSILVELGARIERSPGTLSVVFPTT
jgi:two-component system sensor histidine kinase KdpD